MDKFNFSKDKPSSIRIILIYIIVGGLWITFSDRLLSVLLNYPLELTNWQTIKGWLYVIVTACLLYFLIRQFEKSIKANEEKFRKLFYGINDTVFLNELTEDGEPGKFIEVNDIGCQNLGYTREEFSKMTLWDIDTKENIKEIENVKKNVFTEGNATYERNFVSKRGFIVPVEINTHIFELNGKKVLLSVARDLTGRKRVEQALRRERDKVQKYLDIASVILIVIDSEQKVSLINKKGCEVLKYEEKEIIGKNWFDNFIPEKDRTEIKAVFTKLLAGETEMVEYYENPVLTKDGEERIIAWHNNIIRNETRNIIGVISSGEDITDRKQAEKALQESRARNQAILTAIPDLMFQIDKNGIFLNYKGAMEDLYVPPEQFLGKNILEVLPREFAEMVMNYVHKVLETGKLQFFEYQLPIKGVIHDYEGRMVICDESSVLSIVRDITERKKVESALRESEAKFRALAETSPSAIFVYREKFLYANLSSENLTGFNKEEIANLNFWDVVHPDFREMIKQRGFARQRGETVPTHYEFKILRKDGEERWIDFSGVLIQYEGKPAGLGTAFDITDRKKNQEQLIQTERLVSIGKLASAVAHEVNNPLEAIKSRVQLLQEELAEKKDTKEYVNDLIVIDEQINRVAEIVRNLLEFTRMRIKKPFIPTDINGILRNIIELEKYNFKSGNIEVTCDFNYETPKIPVDPDGMQQVFLNVIHNAIESMSNGGKLRIITDIRNDSQKLIISFTDTGKGIEPEDTDKVFEPFFSTKRKGTGLGLAISHNIIQQHQGMIKIDSSPKKGTTVAIELPIRESEAENKEIQ